MRKLFAALSTARPAAPPQRRGAEPLSQLRASLDGLEVRDSTWDEWLACQRSQPQPAAPRQPSVKQ